MSLTNYGTLERKKCIQHSDPGKILDLILRCNESACSSLQVKINLYLMEETECDVVFQIIVNMERNEAYIEVVNETILERKMKIGVTPKFMDILKSSVEYLDLLLELPPDVREVVLPFYLHPNKRLAMKRKKDLEVESAVGLDKVRVVMLGIADSPFSDIICVVAPNIPEDHVAICIHELFLFVWPTFNKAINLEYQTMLKHKNQLLLRIAKRLFTQVMSLEGLLTTAKEQAKILTKSQHCLLKLVDVEKMELVDPAIPRQRTLEEKSNERRFPLKLGLAGSVIQNGFLINVREPMKHEWFNEQVDSVMEGYNCRDMLVFPIRDSSGINGVGHIINKHDGSFFDSVDEEMALAFSVYCGLSISQAIIYMKLQEANIRNSLVKEVVLYHLKATDAEIDKILKCPGFHSHPQLADLNFIPRVLPYKELPCYFIKMLKNLGHHVRFKLKEEKLAAFVLRVKKGYRVVPYHNWLHAISTVQWAYAALVNLRLVRREYFTELQEMMYLIAALCHDINHRGVTSTYQLLGQTSIAALYTSEASVMERHHLAQTMCILNTEGSDILENLPRNDYDKAILMLRDFILATDIASFVKNYQDYKVIAFNYQKEHRSHIAALQAIMMTCADLNDQLKDWKFVKKSAAATIKEFFVRGDPEKDRGDLPRDIMDKEQLFIPDMQIEFLNNYCIPVYGLLEMIFPKIKEYEYIKHMDEHVLKWEDAKLVFNVIPPSQGIALLSNPELENMIEEALLERQRKLLEAEEEDENK